MAPKKIEPPTEGAKPGEEDADVKPAVSEYEIHMDEDSAQDILANPPPETPESMSLEDVGKHKVKRLPYDLACIMGGRITGVIRAKSPEGEETDKIGLLIQVDGRQGPIENFIVWPVKELADVLAPITQFEINKAE